MTTANVKALSPDRLRSRLLRRLAIGASIALIAMIVASGPASAASGKDGTSNTIQYALASAVLSPPAA